MKAPLLTAIVIAIAAANSPAQTELVAPTAAWDYLHPVNGSDPAAGDPDFATTWFTYGGSYNGPAFTTNKPGPFHYGGIEYFPANGLTGTPIGVNGSPTAPASGLRYTAYFKKQFTTTIDYNALTMDILADDGAVIYIDGVARARVNMTGTVAGNPNGTGDTYTMLADGASNEMVLGTPLRLGPLAAGTHVIAVSLHNALNSSSDLGLYLRLNASNPPLLRTNLAGTTTDVAPLPFTGWIAALPGNFILSGAGAPMRDIESQPVDLSAAGEVYFSMQLYAYEQSATSNFEPNDEFSAKLLVTMDDDTQTEFELIPADLDLDRNGALSGDELNPGALPVANAILAGRQLTAVIPANVKAAALKVSAVNDSTSEFFSFGGALISDVPPGSDADGDGMTREVELFLGTNPADRQSSLRMESLAYRFQAADNTWHFDFSIPGIYGSRYAAETSADGGVSWRQLGVIIPNTTGDYGLSIGFGNAPPARYMVRVRGIP